MREGCARCLSFEDGWKPMRTMLRGRRMEWGYKIGARGRWRKRVDNRLFLVWDWVELRRRCGVGDDGMRWMCRGENEGMCRGENEVDVPGSRRGKPHMMCSSRGGLSFVSRSWRGTRGSRSNEQSRHPRTPADRLSILKATAFFALGIVFVRSSLGGALVPVF
jgi:hypothetical protein